MEKKNYSYDEAYGESLKYFQGDELAARVWVNKYAVKDSFGNIYEKSPEDMHWRIANEVARIEAKYPNPLSSEELFGLLDHFKYIVPQGSPMTGIGNNYQVASLSNCFVIGVDGEADSYGAIFKIDEEQVQLMKRRGGVGHDLSHIRPKGSPVKNSALTSTGLVPFMERYSNSTREVAQDGRRNIACLTIAPTGTTSLMTQTTSGIEPVFLPVYKRRRKVNPNDTNVHVDFIDETGDAFEEYIVFHAKFVTWMEAQGYNPAKRYTQEEVDALVEKSPYYKATSNDVDWLMKVKMQGRIQKWVDHSISVTINLPNDVDEDLVNRLYVEAWKSGCKGCTVYRDGSRSGVLISTKSDKKSELPPCKPPTVVETRPRILDADVVRFQNNKEKWVAFVGLLDNHPYEIFTGVLDDDEGIILPKNVVSGHIIKNVDEHGNKRYDFQFENKRGYKVTIEGLSEKFNKEYWNYAKLISGVLRYRMPIEQVIKLVGSLQLDSENINTWKNGVERALKKYIQDGTEAKGKKCPNCGNETLVYQEGCLICKTCGASRCG